MPTQSESEDNKKKPEKNRLGKNSSRNKRVGSDGSQQRFIWKPEVVTLGAASIAILVLIVIAFIAGGKDSGIKALNSTIPVVAAIASSLVIAYWWRRNYEQNAQRMDDENRRHREQTRTRRQENLGDRLASAIDHLSKRGVVEQVAGLTELAGIADDWWNLGEEMREEVVSRYANNSLFTDDERDRQLNQIDDLVRTRRQEIIDLIFKTPLPTIEEDSQKEQLRDRQVQERRSQLLRNHVPEIEADVASENKVKNSQIDASSWIHLNFEYTDLRNCNLAFKNLPSLKVRYANLQGANLLDTNLQGADLRSAKLQNARLDGANLQSALLLFADMQCADLVAANLRRAKLHHANLQRANLQAVNLSKAILFCTNLKDADLDDFYLGSPSCDERTENLSEKNLENLGFSKNKSQNNICN